jgi:uncharacterized RDD family membrane protein YckC
METSPMVCPNPACARDLSLLVNALHCPDCGAKLPVSVELVYQKVESTQEASRFQRVAGWAIDALIAGVPALLGLVPVIGQAVIGLLLSAYWLLRDIGGASLGKRAAGTRIYSTSGTPATPSQRILRNLPLILPELLLMIPVIGMALGPAAAIAIWGMEAVVLLLTRRRIGDRLAGTMIVRVR